jgi:hypothetical protein
MSSAQRWARDQLPDVPQRVSRKIDLESASADWHQMPAARCSARANSPNSSRENSGPRSGARRTARERLCGPQQREGRARGLLDQANPRDTWRNRQRRRGNAFDRQQSASTARFVTTGWRRPVLMPRLALPIGMFPARRIAVIDSIRRMAGKAMMRVAGMVVQRMDRGRCQQVADN